MSVLTGRDRRTKGLHSRTQRRPPTRLLALVALAPLAVVAQSDEFGTVRQEFIKARAEASMGINTIEDGDSRALRRYVLYPYLTAARIERRLVDATEAGDEADALARRFLAQHESEPVAFDFRRRWLTSLARRADWEQFLAIYQRETSSLTLECQYLRARIAIGQTDGLADLLVDRWLTPNRLPTECEPAFQWARDEGILDAEVIEQRVRMLLENGQAAFARVIARRLPDERAAPLLQWARLLQNPIAELDRLIAAPQTKLAPDALIGGWARFAIANPEAALERFSLVQSTLGRAIADADRLTLDLAFGLAWDRRAAAAIEFFGRVDSADLDDYALGWLSRAGLWDGDWQLAEQAIAAMTPAGRQQAVWRYWTARSLQAQDREDEARPLFESVIGDDNYYSAMAGAHIGRRIEPHVVPLRLDDNLADRLATSPPFVRARELFLAGLRTEATREWQEATAGLDESARRQSVRLAADWGWYDVAVATATRQEIFNDYELLYPRPFNPEVEAAAELTGLTQPLIYGMLRQESLFREDAVSSAGAIGLAQLRLDTARGTAGRWQLPQPERADLFDPGTNIRLGAAELRTLLGYFGDQLPVALAAYNAGPNAAARWLPSKEMAPDIWVENIPYNETRAYVRRVLWHSLVFDWLESARPQDTAAWLAPVQPVTTN